MRYPNDVITDFALMKKYEMFRFDIRIYYYMIDPSYKLFAAHECNVGALYNDLGPLLLGVAFAAECMDCSYLFFESTVDHTASH